MLITRMTPKVMANPRALRIRMELRLRLLEMAELRSAAPIPGPLPNPKAANNGRATATTMARPLASGRVGRAALRTFAFMRKSGQGG